DADPCTIDACRGGACRHDPDGSGPECPALAGPYRTLLGLLQHARDLDTALQGALSSGCLALGPGCDVTPGPDPTRLAALLGQTEGDLAMAALALARRLAGSPPADVQRDPTVRERLALGLLAATPDEFRAFLATLAQAR